MSVRQLNKIDFLGIDETNQEVIMGISNNLDWNNKYNHLISVQLKLNYYFSLVKTGELFKKHPKAKEKKVIIEVHCKHPHEVIAKDFYNKSGAVLRNENIELKTFVLQPK